MKTVERAIAFVSLVFVWITGSFYGFVNEAATTVVVLTMMGIITTWFYASDFLRYKITRKQASNYIIGLGFLGTVIGLSEALHVVYSAEVLNQETVGSIMQDFLGGVWTAISTTLVGLIIYLYLQFFGFLIDE